VTELAVFGVDSHGLVLKELAPSVTLDQVKEKTDADFRVDLDREGGK
jgi:acyl CoA:acetate/3-ketoacid CoA transferase beta subunit